MNMHQPTENRQKSPKNIKLALFTKSSLTQKSQNPMHKAYRVGFFFLKNPGIAIQLCK